jgi:hypothetical protein
MIANQLNDKHVEQLEQESGISKETATKAGIISFSAEEAHRSIGIGGSGIGFPYYNTEAELIGYRIKQDSPLVDKNGKSAKYLTEKSSNAYIFFPLENLSQIMNSDTLIIIEGEKKLLKLNQEKNRDTLPAISIAGCWMYRKKEQAEDELHPILQEIIKNKSIISIIPDSDYFQNHKVRAAYNNLARILFGKGIKVSIIDIRVKNCDTKIGVDDFLMVLPFEKLKERMSSPYVTFANLSSEEIIGMIGKNGISDKVLEGIFNNLAFLDQFQITEKIEAIKKCGNKLKEKDLLARFNKSKNHFQPIHNEESPENYVKWNSRKDGHDVLLKEVGKILSKMGHMYLNEDSPNKLVYVSQDFSKVTTANTRERLFDLLGALFVIEIVRDTNQGKITIGTEPMNRNLVSIFYSSLGRYVIAPRVVLISQTPFFSLIENKLLSMAGYYQKEKLIITKSFKSKKENQEKINFFLENIPFRSEVDKQNFLGIMLTGAIYKNALPGAFPSVLIRAQEHGSGKSQLASSLQYLIEGKNYGMITFKNDTELEKHFAAQIESTCIIIDNLRQGNLDSTFLEKAITDPVISYRRLGTQEEIKKINNTLVVLTMNGGGMTSDLVSRCIVIELDKDNQKKSKGFNPLEYMQENREEIIEEMIGLIENANLINDLEFYLTRFPKWEKLLKNSMTANNFNLFLSNISDMHETIDQNLACILNLAIRNPDSFTLPKSATDILFLLEQKKTFGEQGNLSAQKIGRTLSSVISREISFVAFDNLRYDFFINKEKDYHQGGSNYAYSFKFCPQRSVTSVRLIDESNINGNNFNRKNISTIEDLHAKSNHGSTRNF